MKIYLTTSGKLIDYENGGKQITAPLQFYQYDTTPIELQLLEPNLTGGLNAYNVIGKPYVTESIAFGIPSYYTSSVICSTTLSYISESIEYTGSATFSSSLLNNLLNAGSQSYMEVQENDDTYTLTYCQLPITILPSLDRS